MAVLFRPKRPNQSGPMAGVGYQDAFPRPRLSGRCRFSQGTFAATGGNGARRAESVLADLSGRYPPTEWARLAIAAYATHRADRIVAEVNNGGDIGRGDALHGRPKRGVYRGPRLARQGGAGRTGGGALPAGPRPSHRHLPATRRPDDKFYLGHRSGRSGASLGPYGIGICRDRKLEWLDLS